MPEAPQADGPRLTAALYPGVTRRTGRGATPFGTGPRRGPRSAACRRPGRRLCVPGVPPLPGLLLSLALGAAPSRGGALGAAPEAEARTLAAPDLTPPALLLEDPRAWGLDALGWAWQEPPPTSARGPAPIFVARRPEEWIGLVTRQLRVEDSRVARAAAWVLTAPVRVDVSTRHVFVAVRFRAF